MTLPLARLKIFALTWAINHCRSKLGQAPQRLSIETTNRPLAPNECEQHEKKIVIGDKVIVTYEHYSEPGNPFLSYRYEDFYHFMRSWFAPTITRMIQDWLITNPEYQAGQEKAKASGDWVNHMLWSTQKSTEGYDAVYWSLDKSLSVLPIRLVKLLLFGCYKFSYRDLEKELIGEWISQNDARYVFGKDRFTCYDEKGQPKQFSYRIRAIRDRYLSLDTVYLSNNSANNATNSATLYFFDDCRTLEYRTGSYTTIWRRSDNPSDISSQGTRPDETLAAPRI